MAGPVSGLPTLGLNQGGGGLPTIGLNSGGPGAIPAIGLPPTIVGQHRVSSFDPLGVFSTAPSAKYRPLINQNDFTSLIVHGNDAEAYKRYMQSAIQLGADPHKAYLAAQQVAQHVKQQLTAPGFDHLIASGQPDVAMANYQKQLVARGMDPATAWAAARTAAVRSQQGLESQTSVLSALGTLLNIPSHIVAHYMQGAHDYKTSGNFLGDAFGPLWAGVEKAATTSPITKYGVEDYLTQASQDPGNGWMRNRLVQFSVATLTDPVNYLTLGATAPAKIAASRALAESWGNSSREAIALLAGKGSKDTLKQLGLERTPMKLGTEVSNVIHDTTGNPVSYDELKMMVHMQMGRPVSLSDALIDLRSVGMQRKTEELFHPIQQYQARRAGEMTVATGPRPGGAVLSQGPIKAAIGTAGRMATSLALPTNVGGGAGVRFAGATIPGTARAGAALSREVRGVLSSRAAAESRTVEGGAAASIFGHAASDKAPIVRGLAGAFVPRWRAGIVADDADRALANLKLNNFRFRTATLEGDSGLKASKMAQITADGSRITPAERRGLLQAGGPAPSKELHMLKMNINGAVAQIKTAGDKAGLGAGAFDNLWAKMVDKHLDPLNALAEFKFRAEGVILRKQFIQELLGDPQFSRKWFESATEENLSHFAVYGDHSMIPHGFVPFHWEGKSYVVKSTIRDALDEFAKTGADDRSVDDFLRLLKIPQNYWRVFATAANPGFHTMIFTGNLWNSLYSGIYNPMDYFKAAAALYNGKLGEMEQVGQKALGGLISPGALTPVSAAARASAHATVAQASKRGSLWDRSIFQEMTTGKPFATLPGERTIGTQAKQLIIRRPDETKKAFAFRQSRRAVGGALAATGNPLAVAAFAPEIAGVGRKVGESIENVVRLAPFMRASKDPDNIRLIEKYGPIRIPGLTHPGFTKAQQTAQYDIGAAISAHFHFDYGDLTVFERKWAKTFFPFWIFMKNNFLLQAKVLANRPRFVNSALAMENFISQNGQPIGPEAELLPGYFGQLNMFQVPVPKAVRGMLGFGAGPLYLNPKLPFAALNLFPPLWEIAKNNGMTNSQRFGLLFSTAMGAVGPWSPFPVPGGKIMLEAWVNTQLGLNQKIDFQRANSNDTRDTFVDAPGWVSYLPSSIRNFLGVIPLISKINPFANTVEVTPGHFKMTATSKYILDQMASPFITNLGNTAAIGDPGVAGQKAMAKTVSWLTGIRLTPVDTLNLHRSWAYQMRDMLQSERAVLKKQGKDLSPQDLYAYHEILQSLRVMEAAYKLREQQMYPTTGSGVTSSENLPPPQVLGP